MSARFTNLQPADTRMFIRKTLNNDAKQMKPKKKKKYKLLYFFGCSVLQLVSVSMLCV